MHPFNSCRGHQEGIGSCAFKTTPGPQIPNEPYEIMHVVFLALLPKLPLHSSSRTNHRFSSYAVALLERGTCSTTWMQSSVCATPNESALLPQTTVPQHKKRRPSANFCKHRSWILANTSEIQHNAGTVERTETHTKKEIRSYLE